MAMSDAVRAVLSEIKTVEDMIAAFADEQHCRRLIEEMVWPNGRICPACGYKHSIKIAGRDMGRQRARPGLYQCSNGDCRFQFTVTTRTPLHSTKLSMNKWLKALWLVLQPDKGLSSVRLAEAIGISQPAAWRMGHALRLLAASETKLSGTVEIDEFFLGSRPKKKPGTPPPGRGRKGQKKTTKKPVLAMVRRPSDLKIGEPAGDARAAIVADRSAHEVEAVLENEVDPEARLMSDEAKAFIAAGEVFAKHETVCHSKSEYARGAVHTNSVEGFNARVRRTIAGVFHHISPQHAGLYLHEMGFRWPQRMIKHHTTRRTKSGHETQSVLWDRIPPALQLPRLFQAAVGRQMRRTGDGGIAIKSQIAVFGL